MLGSPFFIFRNSLNLAHLAIFHDKIDSDRKVKMYNN